MKIYNELREAIKEVTADMDETEDFKMQFSNLIDNYFENSYGDSDVKNLIEKVKFEEVSSNGN
jgi:hypothetical protein